jgi:hypothetical protein
MSKILIFTHTCQIGIIFDYAHELVVKPRQLDNVSSLHRNRRTAGSIPDRGPIVYSCIFRKVHWKFPS